ncbi:MAG: type III secretion HpaP family protein [Candidatus Competibacteraceae bacterium]
MNRITEKTGGSGILMDTKPKPDQSQGRDLKADKQRFTELLHGKREPVGEKNHSPTTVRTMLQRTIALGSISRLSSVGSKPKVKAVTTAQPQTSDDGTNVKAALPQTSDKEPHLLRNNDASDKEVQLNVSPHAGKSASNAESAGTDHDALGVIRKGMAQTGMQPDVQTKGRKGIDEDVATKPSYRVPEPALNQNSRPAESITPQAKPSGEDSAPVRTDPPPVIMPTDSIEDPEELLPQTEPKRSKQTRRPAQTTASVNVPSDRKSADSKEQQDAVPSLAEMGSANVQPQHTKQERRASEHYQQPPPSAPTQPDNKGIADHASNKDKTKKVAASSTEASGDRILQGMMGTGPTPTPPTVDNPVSAPSDRIGDIADKLAQRILVSDPSSTSDSEVRIHLRDSVLQGSEVTVRQEQGQLVVGFNVPNNEVHQQLQPHTDNLQQLLGDKLNQPVRVEVNVQSGGAGGGGQSGSGQSGGGSQGDGHSRNRRDWLDEWESGS